MEVAFTDDDESNTWSNNGDNSDDSCDDEKI